LGKKEEEKNVSTGTIIKKNKAMIKQNKNTPGSVNGTKHNGKYNKREGQNENRGQVAMENFEIFISSHSNSNSTATKRRDIRIQRGGGRGRGGTETKKKS